VEPPESDLAKTRRSPSSWNSSRIRTIISSVLKSRSGRISIFSSTAFDNQFLILTSIRECLDQLVVSTEIDTHYQKRLEDSYSVFYNNKKNMTISIKLDEPFKLDCMQIQLAEPDLPKPSKKEATKFFINLIGEVI